MRTKAIAAPVAVIALLLVSGCLGAVAGDDTGAAAQSDNRTVTVSATGEVTAEADQAVVSLAVVARGDDAETARERLARNVSQLREGLAAAGVDDDQVTTSGYDLGREHRPEREGGEEPAYVARQSFQVTLNDTDRAGEVVDAAVGNGATDVDGVRFGLSAQRHDELEEQALEAAVDRARAKAGTLASRSNMTIVEARTVTAENGGHGPVFAQRTAVADAGGSTTIDSGPVTVTASVRVTYHAE